MADENNEDDSWLYGSSANEIQAENPNSSEYDAAAAEQCESDANAVLESLANEEHEVNL